MKEKNAKTSLRPDAGNGGAQGKEREEGGESYTRDLGTALGRRWAGAGLARRWGNRHRIRIIGSFPHSGVKLSARPVPLLHAILSSSFSSLFTRPHYDWPSTSGTEAKKNPSAFQNEPGRAEGDGGKGERRTEQRPIANPRRAEASVLWSNPPAEKRDRHRHTEWMIGVRAGSEMWGTRLAVVGNGHRCEYLQAGSQRLGLLARRWYRRV